MSSEDEINLRRLADRTIERYDQRFRALGVSARTLGWGSRQHQSLRFAALRSLVDLRGRDILDWGCGFGDLATHLVEHHVGFRSYHGVDLNPDLVSEAERIHLGRDSVSFEVTDAERPLPRGREADVVVMLGLANFKQSDLDTETYARMLLQTGFEAARHAVVCDFLSDVPTPGYEREDFVHYYDPALVLGWAFQLSDDVILKHDYPAIPQREFLIKVVR